MQRQMLYRPQPRQVDTPLLTLPTSAGNVLVSVKERAGADVLLYFGGNAEDVSLSFEALASLFPKHSIYLLHYRGFGGSAGEPDEAALIADAQRLFDAVRTRHGRVVVIGRSLGSGVAVQLAASRPVRRLLLVTPFDSIEAVAEHRYPWVPVHWLLKDRFDSAAHVRQITVPVMVLSAGRDQVVPAENTSHLIDLFQPGSVVHRIFPEADHDNIVGAPEYALTLSRFLLLPQE